MDHILGISVTNRSVFGTLVESRSDGPVIVRTISRPRTSSEFDFMMADPAADLGLTSESNGDPTVIFTPVKDDSDLFLHGEFGLKDQKSGKGDSSAMEPVGAIRTQTVEIELKEILAECADAGWPEARVALCLGMNDLAVHELTLQEAERKGDTEQGRKDRRARRSNGERDRLVKALGREVDQRFDAEQVHFLPMTPSEAGRRRLLGVYGRAGEPLIPTLERFVDRGRRMPRFALIETEVSLLLGLVRLAIPSDDPSGTRRLAIRVGPEDTLVLFVEGQNIRHFETLRSITRYDPPETIGSRILLLQDEYGLGEADVIHVLGDGNEDELVELLAEFFPDSSVNNLRGVLPAYADEYEADESREAALAAAVSLRALTDPLGRDVFEPVNLLPRRLTRRRRVDVPLAWQNYAMLALLFASTLFFVARYLRQDHELGMARQRYERQYRPDVVKTSKKQLDARRDSLFAIINQYDSALQVLDSLLYGSDRWSRAMEHTASNAAAVSGVWVEKWAEEGGELVMTGTATDRNQIVRLAARMDGRIESMTFSSIRDWPVYSYRMVVPLQKDLPEAVHYLREQVQLGLQAHAPGPGAGGSTGADGSTGDQGATGPDGAAAAGGATGTTNPMS